MALTATDAKFLRMAYDEAKAGYDLSLIHI